MRCLFVALMLKKSFSCHVVYISHSKCHIDGLFRNRGVKRFGLRVRSQPNLGGINELNIPYIQYMSY